MNFGSNLARIRRSRGWSQEELSLRSGISQRHVSFLETGRSQPGDQSISKLSSALALRGWEQRALLESLAPKRETPPRQTPDDNLVDAVLRRYSPWPGYAFRSDGSLLKANEALSKLLHAVSPDQDLWKATAPEVGPNIYDLVFHPNGLLRWMENPVEVLAETLRRLRVESSSNQTINETLMRIEGYPSVRTLNVIEVLPPPVLIERYKLGSISFSIISIISHLASPGEIELEQLRFESFVPADETSAKVLQKFAC